MRLQKEIQEIAAANEFSGVVRVSHKGDAIAELCGGFADRRHRRPNEVDTQFGMASVTKGLTALAVGSLIQEGQLHFDTPV